MGSYQSSIGSQLARAERQISAYIRRMLLLLGRQFRARMVRERLSGPPGVFKITGRLMRSLRYDLVATSSGYRLEAFIGGGQAYYAVDHEERGRLEFMNTFQQEASKILEEIKLGLQFFERNAGSVESSSGAGEGEPAVSEGIRAIGEHIRRKREAAKLKRAMNWRSMTRERREPGALSQKRAASRKAKAARIRRDMKWRSISEPVSRRGA